MLEKMLEDHAFCICLRREILQKILYTTRMAKQPIIYLALTDDWELRGNGSGDMDEIQLKPMRRLASIYEKNGARGSFFIEVMQMDSLKNEQQTAKTLNVKVGTLRAWRHKGEGPPFIKLGHAVRYSQKDLQRFVAANRRQSTKDE